MYMQGFAFSQLLAEEQNQQNEYTLKDILGGLTMSIFTLETPRPQLMLSHEPGWHSSYYLTTTTKKSLSRFPQRFHWSLVHTGSMKKLDSDLSKDVSTSTHLQEVKANKQKVKSFFPGQPSVWTVHIYLGSSHFNLPNQENHSHACLEGKLIQIIVCVPRGLIWSLDMFQISSSYQLILTITGYKACKCNKCNSHNIEREAL